MQYNINGFLEIHKVATNPLTMGFAPLNKGLEDQYVIQSCNFLQNHAYTAERQPCLSAHTLNSDSRIEPHSLAK